MQINEELRPDIYNLQPGDVFASDCDMIVVVKPPHPSDHFPDLVQVFAKHNGKNLWLVPSEFVAHVGSIVGMKPVGRLRLE